MNRTLILILASFFSWLAFSGGDRMESHLDSSMGKPFSNHLAQKGAIREFQFEVLGGGDLAYTLRPNGNEFSIHLTRVHFSARNEILRLSHSDSAELFQFVSAIFSERTRPISSPPEEIGGSFTSLRIIRNNGDFEKISYPTIAGEEPNPFTLLSRYVLERI